MDAYCSLEDAFIIPGPVPKKKKSRSKEIPTQPSGGIIEPLEPDRMAVKPPPAEDVLESSQEVAPSITANTSDFFPLPGNTSEPESWEKAFLLQPDWTKIHGIPPASAFSSNNTMAVDGKSTLWRKIPVPAPVPVDATNTQFSEMKARLEELTKQLGALSVPTPIQSTAELFLFVAIGLILLLAIDTLLRYATSVASSRAMNMTGGRRVRFSNSK